MSEKQKLSPKEQKMFAIKEEVKTNLND
jgi:hypothetical protein